MRQRNVIRVTCFFKRVNVSTIVLSEKGNTSITSRISESRLIYVSHIILLNTICYG